jgi:pfkB family carbohydrate kinase
VSDIAQQLQPYAAQIGDLKITAGFDAFVDTVVRLVKEQSNDQTNSTFETVASFGQYVLAKSGGSFSLESQEILTKIGGNMLIMSHALGTLGATVRCVGSFGWPDVVPAFEAVSPRCVLHSFGPPGTCMAVEFDDGKMMIANMAPLHHANWAHLKTTVGLPLLRQLFTDCHAFCLLNWGEIITSDDLWTGILDEILASHSTPNQPFAFFDLSDFSNRKPHDLAVGLDLMRRFAQHSKVVLSLNQNETRLLYSFLAGHAALENFEDMGKYIFNALALDTLTIHSAQRAWAFDANGVVKVDSLPVLQPKILTGAGDHFNAGFLLGKLLNFAPLQALQLANSVAAAYTTNGELKNE